MDREEFETLALEHMQAVYRMALQLTRHPDDAADLVQETYLRALGVADRFEERGGGIRSWLFKILHNAFYSRMSQRRRGPASIDHADLHPDQAPGPDEAKPAWDIAGLDWEHVDDRLKEAIERLSSEYRIVLLLWGVEGMKYREIADVLDVPIGTVMSRLYRARSILVATLAPIASELGLNRPSDDPESESGSRD